jgi:hypothetical protein
MCLTLKLEFSQANKKHNIDISTLYDRVIKENKHYSMWPKYIRDAFVKSM